LGRGRRSEVTIVRSFKSTAVCGRAVQHRKMVEILRALAGNVELGENIPFRYRTMDIEKYKKIVG